MGEPGRITVFGRGPFAARDRACGSCINMRFQQIRQSHTMQHLCTQAIQYGEADIGAVLTQVARESSLAPAACGGRAHS